MRSLTSISSIWIFGFWQEWKRQGFSLYSFSFVCYVCFFFLRNNLNLDFTLWCEFYHCFEMEKFTWSCYYTSDLFNFLLFVTRKTCVNPHIHSGVSSWSWQIIIDWWYKKDQNVTVKDIINIAKLGQMCTISWHCDVKELNVMFTVITCQHGECRKDWGKKGLFVVDICHFIYSTEQWYTVVNQFNQWAEMKNNCTELMKYNWIMSSKHIYKYFSLFNVMHIF